MDEAAELKRRTIVLQGDLGHLYRPTQEERNLAAALIAARKSDGGRLTAGAVRRIVQENTGGDGPVAPLSDLLPLVVNVLEDPEARNSTEGRSALHEVDILLDAVVVYQGPS
ncbi:MULTISPECIES: hypothetical protein [unclassified Streptomyces]|uniref:hypothetical protein n=1 Tax=unclassified Streptomyces TaxID=2593676 RepID=UPI0033BEF1F4